MDDQKAHEKMLNITNYQRKANQKKNGTAGPICRARRKMQM